MQKNARTFHSFGKNAKERKNLAFFLKEPYAQPCSSLHSLEGNNYNRNWKSEAKQSKTKQKIIVIVLQNEAKRKWNGFCFASFRFEVKKNISENGTPYTERT